jgi:uncharacterized membrane protein
MDKLSPAPERRYDMDWLRSLVILSLILFHTARIFDPFEANYVTNGQTSRMMFEIFIGVWAPWTMPLLFFLAGSAAWLALERRTPRQYLGERVNRLLVPLDAVPFRDAAETAKRRKSHRASVIAASSG